MLQAPHNPVTAYIAVGSNMEPEKNLPAALARLIQRVRVVAVSTMYRTPALDRPHQPDFVNGVWSVETRHTPRDLKYTVLRPIEEALGRVRTADAYADRPIDLDIALYGAQVIEEQGLIIPDPDILRRPFLAVPLLELVPDLVLPGSGVRLSEQPVAHHRAGLTPLPELTETLRRMIAT